MRLPRVRFTLRGLMVAVAVACLLAAGQAMRRRSAALAARAAYHVRLAASLRVRLASVSEVVNGPHSGYSLDFGDGETITTTAPVPVPFTWSDPGELVGSHTLSGWKHLASWQEQMSRKYSLASSRPWLPVEPDPPEPK